MEADRVSGTAKRGLVAAVVTAVILVAVGLYIGLYLINVPGSVAATETSAGANLYLGTVAAAKGTDPHPTWVSYYAVNSDDTHWVHATTYTLPANTLVHVTIYQFDGQSGLRNGFLSQATGTVGGNFLLNGKPTQAIDPDTASHVFAIPQIGLSVPLEGVADDAKNPCANAPCPLSTAHFTIQFTFRTPGKGLYRWQCFVPCAAGFIQGFGGPMQTVGYMGGFIKVV
jgi:hypothetical protein